MLKYAFHFYCVILFFFIIHFSFIWMLLVTFICKKYTTVQNRPTMIKIIGKCLVGLLSSLLFSAKNNLGCSILLATHKFNSFLLLMHYFINLIVHFSFISMLLVTFIWRKCTSMLNQPTMINITSKCLVGWLSSLLFSAKNSLGCSILLAKLKFNCFLLLMHYFINFIVHFSFISMLLVTFIWRKCTSMLNQPTMINITSKYLVGLLMPSLFYANNSLGCKILLAKLKFNCFSLLMYYFLHFYCTF